MKHIKLYLSLLILIIIILSGLYVYKWEYRKPVFEIHFFSLNKGRAVFIRTPKDKTFLIGGGQNAEVMRELTKVIPFYKRKIDTVVIPSAVPAQIGGLIEIVSRYSVDEIIMPKILATSTVLGILVKEIHKQKIHVREVERGDRIEIEKDLVMNILFPNADFKFNKTSLPEIGMSISYGSTTAYLLGNLSKTIQKDIAKDLEVKTDENIVEFYNTGSDTKVSSELIKKLNPLFIWNTKEKTTRFISDGQFFQLIK